MTDGENANLEYRKHVLDGLNENEAKVSELLAKLSKQVGSSTYAATTIKHIQIAQEQREALLHNLVIALIPRSAVPIPRDEWVQVPPPAPPRNFGSQT